MNEFYKQRDKIKENSFGVRLVRSKTRSASASSLTRTSNGGYVALISAIIVSFILIALTVSVSTSSYFTRFNVANSEYKRISLGLAESCANVALLKVGQDFSYTPAVGGDTIAIGAESCIIKSVTPRTAVHTLRNDTCTLSSGRVFRAIGH